MGSALLWLVVVMVGVGLVGHLGRVGLFGGRARAFCGFCAVALVLCGSLPAFAAEMVPAHVPGAELAGAASTVDLLGVLTALGVPATAAHWVVLALIGLYVLVTELLPFFPGIKANSVVHGLTIAAKALRVDPVQRSLAVDREMLQEVVAEVLSASGTPRTQGTQRTSPPPASEV